MLVKIQSPVPADITRLTGISQSEVDTKGQPLEVSARFSSIMRPLTKPSLVLPV